MKVLLHPLYSELNAGVGKCLLGCKEICQADKLKPPEGYTCPLSSHQAKTYAAVVQGEADIIFNKSATGDGKSLGASLPGLLNPSFRIMSQYPTIELVEDQTQQQKHYHEVFGLDASQRVDRLFGAELSRRVKQAEKSNKFQELLLAIQQKPFLLTNPDIFHYITHFQYRDAAYGHDLLPLALAEWPDLWVFDEFHIFGQHQEAAVLNSITLIRRTQENQSRPRRFLFTSATPKSDFIEQLRQTGFRVEAVEGVYADKNIPGYSQLLELPLSELPLIFQPNENSPGYRQILQPVELEFVELKETDTLSWLTEMASRIQEILDAEAKGRGLIIVNSVAKAGTIARQLQKLLPGVIVREISGRIDRQERLQTQTQLKDSHQPVLVVGTSAVDVGVDFKIHLLIFESSDSATIVQRLGRLGRHSGFSAYKAFLLIPSHTPWVMARLLEKLTPSMERGELIDAIAYAFDPPKEFHQYSQRWGALQAQGMLARMSQENAKVSQQVRDRMTEDLQRVYRQNLESARKQWFALQYNDVGKAIQNELLRFRGGSTLQAAVWENHRFYTYDLLRVLPYALVEVTDRETFLQAASQSSHGEEEFPDDYIKVYLRVQSWVNERFHLSLHCNRKSSELKCGELSLVDKLSLIGHPQSEAIACLKQKKILAFLVPVRKDSPTSHWEVSKTLNLSPLFGLYRLTDASEETYACAFNQDALLLAALGGKLKKFYSTRFESSIF